MSTATTMITALETFLAENVGIDSINIDGQMVKYSRAQAMEELKYWKRQRAKEIGARRMVQGIRLDTAW